MSLYHSALLFIAVAVLVLVALGLQNTDGHQRVTGLHHKSPQFALSVSPQPTTSSGWHHLSAILTIVSDAGQPSDAPAFSVEYPPSLQPLVVPGTDSTYLKLLPVGPTSQSSGGFEIVAMAHSLAGTSLGHYVDTVTYPGMERDTTSRVGPTPVRVAGLSGLRAITDGTAGKTVWTFLPYHRSAITIVAYCGPQSSSCLSQFSAILQTARIK